MTEPLTTSELLGQLAYGWAEDCTTTIRSTPGRTHLLVRDGEGVAVDVTLEEERREVTGCVRWDTGWILVDVIYDPLSYAPLTSDIGYSGWTLRVTEVGEP